MGRPGNWGEWNTTVEGEGVGRKGEKSCFPFLPAPSPSAVVFPSPQFPACPTICPWVSEVARASEWNGSVWIKNELASVCPNQQATCALQSVCCCMHTNVNYCTFSLILPHQSCQLPRLSGARGSSADLRSATQKDWRLENTINILRYGSHRQTACLH